MVRAKEMGTPVTIDLTKTCADSFLRGRPHAPTMGRFHIFPLPFWELSVDQSLVIGIPRRYRGLQVISTTSYNETGNRKRRKQRKLVECEKKIL